MSALNNLRKKRVPLTLGESKLLVEMVRSYPYFYDKTCKEHKEQKMACKALKCLKRNNSVVADKPFKPSMLSPNVKCILRALQIICAIKNN